MAERIMFVDGVAYTEADMALFQSHLRPDGTLPESIGTYSGLLAVSAPGGMTVRVASGEMMIQGFLYQNDANKDLTIGANSSGSTRIDLVVVRLDRAANLCNAVVKVGTPGAGAPALTQIAGGTWEYSIAQVTVANGAASIVGGNIADQRAYSRYPMAALDTAMATDAEVTAAVNAEATTRSNADSTLTTNLSTETTNRTNADSTLTTNLNNEVTNRTNADSAHAALTTHARAWGLFDISSFIAGVGFSGMTWVSTGRWRFNISPAMPDTNYAFWITTQGGSAPIFSVMNKTTTQLDIQFTDRLGNNSEPSTANVLIHR